EIVEARFIDRLDVQYALDFAAMDVSVPPFTLQPLVENAISHGFQDKDQDCSLTISIQQEGDIIHIQVMDNGQGIQDDRLQTLLERETSSEKGAGIGLYNVNRRLMMHFGRDAGLQITSANGEGTTVSFQLDQGGDSIVSSSHRG